MRLLIPFTVQDANLISTSIAEDDYAVWNVSTAYVVGNEVISTVTHRI
jgi:hypothetical protein